MKRLVITEDQYRKPLLSLNLGGKEYIIKEVYGKYADALYDFSDEIKTKTEQIEQIRIMDKAINLVLCKANNIPEDVYNELSFTVKMEIYDAIENAIENDAEEIKEGLKKTETVIEK